MELEKARLVTSPATAKSKSKSKSSSKKASPSPSPVEKRTCKQFYPIPILFLAVIE